MKAVNAIPATKKKPGMSVALAKGTAVGEEKDWRNELAGYAAKTIKMEESTQSGNRISTQGGRLSYHNTPLKGNEMTVLLLSALVENAYYEGPYEADNPRAPVCFAFSEDGEDMQPHDKAHDKQSEKCEGCPNAVWGSSSTGKGKACKNIRRVAVIPMPEVSLDAIEAAEIATLSIPVMSVKGYSAYVKELALNSNLPPFTWQTRVWLEPDAKSQFRVCFEAVERRPLAEKFYPAILRRVREAEKVIEQPYVYIEPAAEEPKKGAAKKAAAGKKKY
jgi:hypothetical protein